jgi:hypothetical protein
MATTRKSVTVTFAKEKETKNTVRFAEQVKDGEDALVGVLYVQKGTAGVLGNPETLTMTLTAA